MKWIGTLVLAVAAVAFAAEDAQARGGRCGGGRGGCGGGGGFVSHGGCGGQVSHGGCGGGFVSHGWQSQGYVVHGQPSCNTGCGVSFGHTVQYGHPVVSGSTCNGTVCYPASSASIRLSPPPTGSGPPQYVTPPVLVAPRQ